MSIKKKKSQKVMSLAMLGILLAPDMLTEAQIIDEFDTTDGKKTYHHKAADSASDVPVNVLANPEAYSYVQKVIQGETIYTDDGDFAKTQSNFKEEAPVKDGDRVDTKDKAEAEKADADYTTDRKDSGNVGYAEAKTYLDDLIAGNYNTFDIESADDLVKADSTETKDKATAIAKAGEDHYTTEHLSDNADIASTGLTFKGAAGLIASLEDEYAELDSDLIPDSTVETNVKTDAEAAGNYRTEALPENEDTTGLTFNAANALITSLEDEYAELTKGKTGSSVSTNDKDEAIAAGDYSTTALPADEGTTNLTFNAANALIT
ncbi:MAG: hypothetical protein LBS41_05850, partial [Streptococcaceae bacterium]|nr:hypothetical protein [Streptococcaceae bacterium]